MPDRHPTIFRHFLVAIALLAGAGCAAGVQADLTSSVAPDSAFFEPLSAAEIDDAALLLRLEDRREFNAAMLQAAARSNQASTRQRAALAAGRIGAPEGRPLLRVLLADRDTAVIAAAAFMIGQLRDTASVPRLIELIDTAGAGLRPSTTAEAAAALGRIGTAAARDAIASFLLSADTSDIRLKPAVREALIASWRAAQADLAPYGRWITSSDPEIRWRVAYALICRQSPDAVPLLLTLVGDPDPITRSIAIRGLGSSMVTPDAVPRAAIVDTLLAAADDSAYVVRIEAIRVLGTYPDPPAVALLEERLFSESPHEAIVAIEALARGGPDFADRAVARLRQIAQQPDTPDYLREVAIDAAGVIDPTGAAVWIDVLATDSSWRVRTAVARALGKRRADALPLLQSLTRDSDPRVAAGALDALVAAVGPLEIQSLRPILLEMLQHGDAQVRAAALRGFALLSDVALYPALLDAFDRARSDRENDAVLAAIDAIAELGQRTAVATERAFFARFERPEDHLVRQKAAERFPDAAVAAWGEPYPIDTFTQDAGYRRHIFDWQAPPPPLRQLPLVRIETEAGVIDAVLFGDLAPVTVANFLNLAAGGFFDGQEWARIVPNFVVQGGDPRGDTSGGPGYTIRDELNRARFVTGSLGMALAGPDTGGSQFFITHSPQPHLDGGYTVFGSVVRGLEVLQQILPGQRILSVREIMEQE
jgi:cyclophilin family peptidyl-prolyl cis-trans isomerase/HEAT repeat protein